MCFIRTRVGSHIIREKVQTNEQNAILMTLRRVFSKRGMGTSPFIKDCVVKFHSYRIAQ